MTSTMLANFRTRKHEVNLVIDTAAYVSGDLLSDCVEITLDPAGRAVSGTLTGLTLLDKDDEGGLLDLVVVDADVSLGTINDAPNISDANAQAIVAIVPVTSYDDLGGCKVARPSFDPIDFECADGVLRLAALSKDTKTYTAASDLRVKAMIQLHNLNR